MAEQKIEVGTELAIFKHSSPDRIVKVVRITPKGQIVCDDKTRLTQSMCVIGWDHGVAFIASQRDKDRVFVRNAIERIEQVNWHALPIEKLNAVLEILEIGGGR